MTEHRQETDSDSAVASYESLKLSRNVHSLVYDLLVLAGLSARGYLSLNDYRFRMP
jgi:hypothetical protein